MNPATFSEKPLRSSPFGADHGRTVVYFHGAPGAPEEGAVFDACGKEHGLTFVCLDRFAVDAALRGDAYYRVLAQEIARLSAGAPVDVVGFSIGAFVALQTCRHLPHGVRSLHLVSAAAPLDAGDFLDAMAGKQVFRLARAFPLLFTLLSYWQAVLARFFPGALFRLLFASAAGADKTLAADAAFQTRMTAILRSCFMGRVAGYTRDVQAYVRPWKAGLREISAPTTVWHGAQDNWSPKAMADYLQSAIPGCTAPELLEGLSHYTCLYRAAPEICARIAKA